MAPSRRFPANAYAILTAVQERSLGCARDDDAGKGYHKKFEGRNEWLVTRVTKETLIKSLSDFTLEFLCIARNRGARIASYLRRVMTKLCIKFLVKADSAIESAFPEDKSSAIKPLTPRSQTPRGFPSPPD